jgi:hypothetical protein
VSDQRTHDHSLTAGCWAHVEPSRPSVRPRLGTAATAAKAARLWAAKIDAIGQHQVADRPDRYEPRRVKRRPKKYPRLQKPRAPARRRLKKEGEKRSGNKA